MQVLCTAVCAREADPNANFLPLNVDYRERASSWGTIPHTFPKREGAPKVGPGLSDAARHVTQRIRNQQDEEVR